MERTKAGSCALARGFAWGPRKVDVNKMAELMTFVRNTPPHLFTDFLFSEEENILLQEGDADELILLASCCVFFRRKWARISRYFESTVPRYHCDVFRSHFRMSKSTFEMLVNLLAASEHIPKADSPFGRPCIEPQKQVAVAIWALANQESCRQISDRFDVTMSSASRCVHRVTKALVDIRVDLIRWPRGKVFLLLVYQAVNIIYLICQLIVLCKTK